jgi:hypothetical protein
MKDMHHAEADLRTAERPSRLCGNPDLDEINPVANGRAVRWDEKKFSCGREKIFMGVAEVLVGGNEIFVRRDEVLVGWDEALVRQAEVLVGGNEILVRQDEALVRQEKILV